MAEEIIIEKKSPQITKIILAVLISALVFGLLGYYLGKKNENTSPVSAPVAETALTEITATPIPSVSTAKTNAGLNGNVYQNSDFGFKFALPSGYSIEETPMYEGARGVKISFGKNKTPNISETNFVNLEYIVEDANLEGLENRLKNDNGSDLSERRQFKVDNQDAISYTIVGFASGKAIISTNGSASVKINVYPDNDETKVFAEQLASTFKFK